MTCNGEGNPSPKIFDQAYVLMHRSDDYELKDKTMVVSVFHFDIANYEPDECPYCKAGSQAIKPKLENNWQKLHGVIE